MRPGGRPEAVPLHATERNPSRETAGRRVAAVSSRIGEPFIPWQVDASDIFGEIDPATGYPWYKESLLVAERQVGKTTFLRAKLTDRCLFTPRATVRYTAQNRNMALQRLEHDFWFPIAASPLRAFLDLREGRRTKKPGLAGKNGQEHIAFGNGSGWWIDSVKATSGHGPTLHETAIDEAFAHQDSRLEQSARPAMNNIPSSQLLIASAAGDASSTYLRDKLDTAIARLSIENAKPMHQRRSRTALIHYAAAPDEDPNDPATWWHRHPALGYLVDEPTFHAALEGFESDPDEFYRGYLGWWPKAKVPDPVVPRLAWKDCGLELDEGADTPWTGAPVWSVDVSPDRDWSAVGMAARFPGRRAWLEVLDHEQGTHWPVRRLVQLRGQVGGNRVVIDSTGAAGALEQDLLDEDFEVVRLNTVEKADACGAFYDDALTTLLAHGDDPVLNAALFSAVKHRIGDRWVFWRGKSLQDITALYAVVLARFELARTEDYDPLANIF